MFLECAAAAEFDRHRRSQMQQRGMLVDYRRRLRAPVSEGVVEIESSNTVFAKSALERGTAVHLFGCVISHIFSVVLATLLECGQWVRDFRVGRRQDQLAEKSGQF